MDFRRDCLIVSSSSATALLTMIGPGLHITDRSPTVGMYWFLRIHDDGIDIWPGNVLSQALCRN